MHSVARASTATRHNLDAGARAALSASSHTNTTLVQPSCLSLNILYARGPSASGSQCEITKSARPSGKQPRCCSIGNATLDMIARAGHRPLLYVTFLSYSAPGGKGKCSAVCTPTLEMMPAVDVPVGVIHPPIVDTWTELKAHTLFW